MSARALIGNRVYKKKAFNIGSMPTWFEAAKMILQEKIKQGKSCIPNEQKVL